MILFLHCVAVDIRRLQNSWTIVQMTFPHVWEDYLCHTPKVETVFLSWYIFYWEGNIPKIPTPLELTLPIHSIQILNKLIQPILLIHLHMPTHPKDTHLIQDIKNHIKEFTEKYPTKTIFWNGDFDKDIDLTRRTLNDLLQPSTVDDLHWYTFTSRIGLHPIRNFTKFIREGEQNYTSTSHIDGFYTNQYTLLRCKTKLNLNQNFDHYAVNLDWGTNSISQKIHHHTTTTLESYTLYMQKNSKTSLPYTKKQA